MKIAINWKKLETQKEALKYLEDKETEEIVFGGGAGGGKTFLICAWIIKSCFKYSGSRWFIGRKELKRLKQTTLSSFLEILKMWKLSSFFKINWQDSVIRCVNGTEIVLLDLIYLPSDPHFERFGSFEFTGGAIDEAGEVKEKCVSMLRSRLRYKIEEFNLTPKIFMTCNPTRNFIYRDFYKAKKDGKIKEYRKFVKSLCGDNSFLPENYQKTLSRIADKSTRERLLFGNWEWDDDPALIFSFDKILDIFTNTAKFSREKYLVADIARMGGDRIVIGIWRGLKCEKIKHYQYKKLNETKDIIQSLASQEQIPYSNILIDQDGMGGGVLDYIPNAKGFMNGGKIIQPKDAEFDESRRENFINLKSQCWFELAELVENGKIEIKCENEIKEMISEELGIIKEKNVGSDGKRKIMEKNEIKEIIGRSPDFGDMLMMRMYFELMKKSQNEFVFSL